MNIFNERQKIAWNNMLLLIESYESNKISFFDLVSNLEKILDEGEFNDKELIIRWYKVWGTLETSKAVALDRNLTLMNEKVEEDVQEMKRFLLSKVK